MAFVPRKETPKWNWRAFLTEEEQAVLKLADGAKLQWLQANRERAAITNRAIQRAKYHSRQAVDA